jgi:hypothetical protein
MKKTAPVMMLFFLLIDYFWLSTANSDRKSLGSIFPIAIRVPAV